MYNYAVNGTAGEFFTEDLVRGAFSGTNKRPACPARSSNFDLLAGVFPTKSNEFRPQPLNLIMIAADFQVNADTHPA